MVIASPFLLGLSHLEGEHSPTYTTYILWGDLSDGVLVTTSEPSQVGPKVPLLLANPWTNPWRKEWAEFGICDITVVPKMPGKTFTN